MGKVINHYKMAKHFTLEITDESFTFTRNSEAIAAEAALDGIYVLRTSLPTDTLAEGDVALRYKGLEDVERFFRTLNTELEVRPIRHRLADRVRAHMFLRMLSYYLVWHMKKALAPILFVDNDKPAAAAKRVNPVAAAQRSDTALAKAARKRTTDDTPVHSFTSLLTDLGHPLRQPDSARRRQAGLHHDHQPHPAAAAGLRTPRRLPPPRPAVVSTTTRPDSKPQVNTPTRQHNRGNFGLVDLSGQAAGCGGQGQGQDSGVLVRHGRGDGEAMLSRTTVSIDYARSLDKRSTPTRKSRPAVTRKQSDTPPERLQITEEKLWLETGLFKCIVEFFRRKLVAFAVGERLLVNREEIRRDRGVPLVPRLGVAPPVAEDIELRCIDQSPRRYFRTARDCPASPANQQ